MQQVISRTPAQQQVVQQLVSAHNIRGDRILFLNKNDSTDPWIPYDQLLTIARQSGEFNSIAAVFDQFITELRQVVWVATVVDPEGRSYTRGGVATIGETLPNEEEPDEHNLAASRALKLALDAAGFNPVKAAPVVMDLKLAPGDQQFVDQAESRRQDLKAIHALAQEKGLIVPLEEDPSQKDWSGYRSFLIQNFGTNTTVEMGPSIRSQVINALRQLPDPRQPKTGTHAFARDAR